MIELCETVFTWLRGNAEIIVALCALALSVHQGIVSRRHERLAARPFLRIDRRFVLEEGRVEIILCNHGPGVAEIVEFAVFLDACPVEASHDLWFSLGRNLNVPFLQGAGTQFSPGDMVPPHSTVVLASYRAEGLALVSKGPEVVAQMARIEVVVSYKSVFGETFRLVEKGA